MKNKMISTEEFLIEIMRFIGTCIFLMWFAYIVLIVFLGPFKVNCFISGGKYTHGNIANSELHICNLPIANQ